MCARCFVLSLTYEHCCLPEDVPDTIAVHLEECRGRAADNWVKIQIELTPSAASEPTIGFEDAPATEEA